MEVFTKEWAEQNFGPLFRQEIKNCIEKLMQIRGESLCKNGQQQLSLATIHAQMTGEMHRIAFSEAIKAIQLDAKAESCPHKQEIDKLGHVCGHQLRIRGLGPSGYVCGCNQEQLGKVKIEPTLSEECP